MIPLGAISYIIYSGIFVVCLFLGIRCLFAHEERRELWRSVIKHRVYVSPKTFKVLTILAGWILLLIALFVAYSQITALLEK
jgi:hypothetical protein